MTVSGEKYVQFYAGCGRKESVNNPGNDNRNYPPMYTLLSGGMSSTAAAQACIQAAYNGPNDGTDALFAGGKNYYNVYQSVDLHYLESNSTWMCVSYYNSHSNTTYFNVDDANVSAGYGYTNANYSPLDSD